MKYPGIAHEEERKLNELSEGEDFQGTIQIAVPASEASKYGRLRKSCGWIVATARPGNLQAS
jgi:hypothetical protein